MTRNPKHKRELPFTIEETLTPPDALPETHCIARITKAAGHNTYNAQLPDGQPVLVELEEKFRSSIWIKRGSYVVVDTSTARSGLDGDIVNVVRDEKAWRKKKYWPSAFAPRNVYDVEADYEDSTVGKMPPASDDEE